MIDSGKLYASHQSMFANSIWEMAICFKGDKESVDNLKKISDIFHDIGKFQSVLLEQASKTILTRFNAFVKEWVSVFNETNKVNENLKYFSWTFGRKIKESKESHNHFEKVSADYDAALIRNSQVSKFRPQEVEEVDNVLSATKTCFRHTALDHVYCLSMLHANKKPELFSAVSI